MKLREIVRFELAYQLRRVSPWLSFTVLLTLTFLLMATSIPTDGDELRNSPFTIAFATVLGGALWLLLGASVAGDAAARDVQTRMYPLTYTAPVSKGEYLGGRFVAAFVLNAAILLATPLGILLALLLPSFDPVRLDPFRPAAYLTAYGCIALPFAFVATAFQFAWAALSRRPMTSYLASVLLFVISHFVMITVAQLLGRWNLVRLLDLVGFAGIVTNLDESWTALEKNTRLVGVEPTLLLNRALWLTVALAVLALTYTRFRLAHPSTSSRRGRIRWRRIARSASSKAGHTASGPIIVPAVGRSFGFATYARQTLGIAGDSFRAITRSRAGLTLVILFALHLVVFMPEYIQFMGVPMFPTTERVVGPMTAAVNDLRTPLVIIPLLIAYYAGELIWRERDAGMGDIAGATPVPEWALFGGKFLGLGLVIVGWLALLATAGMLAQLVMGYRDLKPGLYLTILFGLQLPEYLLFACLALALHVLVNQRYVGHMVVLLALGLIGFAPRLGIRHNLLIYGASPVWSYTEMRGFGPTLEPWLWFKLYWAAWALLLVVAARLLWVRGHPGSLRARLQLARHRMTRPTVATAATGLALVLALGGTIFYTTTVQNPYRTPANIAASAAAYEQRYGQYRNISQPRLAATTLRVEIYPARQAATIHGTYRLENLSGEPIDVIHVATVPDVTTENIAFDRPAAQALTDEELGYRIYTLQEPLAPGATLQLSFDVRYAARGFRNDGVDLSVVPNGTLFTNQDWLPAIGYQPQRELRDPGERQAQGLAARPAIPSLYDAQARQYMGSADLIAFEAVVGTDGDQVAIAPGLLRQSWTEDGRRYFRYAAEAPIRNEFNIFSARYAVREAQWTGTTTGQPVAIQIYHDPRHTAGLDRMVRSIQASLSHYTQQFGPYPYRHIRFVEHAGGDGGMAADASSITYDEGFADFNPGDPARSLDLPFYIVAHEVAHQWWGAQVASAYVEGAWLMSESLAVYSGMQVLEETYGQDQVRRYLELVRNIYEYPRSRAAVPLLRADSSFLGYRKGAIALHALRRAIGEERLNSALRRLVEQHATGAPPLPTTLDLYRELQAVTPAASQPLLHDLFEVNTFWELRAQQATATPTADGAWEVALEVRARKVVVDEAGVETEVPMDDPIAIGVFGPSETGAGGNTTLYRQEHRIRSGTHTITVTVPRQPSRAGIDPELLLIDLQPDDNVVSVAIDE